MKIGVEYSLVQVFETQLFFTRKILFGLSVFLDTYKIDHCTTEVVETLLHIE